MNDATSAPTDAARSAIVLFSGGQDSTVCLAWALRRYASVETVAFDYGQRHRIELEQRLAVRNAIVAAFANGDRLGADHLLDLAVLGAISDTALTDGRAIEMQANGLPNTFVPGRNLMFFTLAAALAYRRGIDVLIGGMCETDFSGYPDCRDTTLRSQQITLELGLAQKMEIVTPLMWLDKAAIWALADELGGHALVDIVVEHSHTCYLGERGVRHDWGYGCGQCPACTLRKAGWARWRSALGTVSG